MTGVMGSQEPALVVPVLGNLLLKPGASNVENKQAFHPIHFISGLETIVSYHSVLSVPTHHLPLSRVMATVSSQCCFISGLEICFCSHSVLSFLTHPSPLSCVMVTVSSQCCFISGL